MLWNFAAFFSAASLDSINNIQSILHPGYKGLWVAAKYLVKPERWPLVSLRVDLSFLLRSLFIF